VKVIASTTKDRGLQEACNKILGDL
jgi:hypothetical protein